MVLDYELVGKRIRESRCIRNISRNALAEAVGLSPASLRHIESGFSKPSLQTLCHIADILDISLDFVTGRTESMSDSLSQQLGLNDQQAVAVRQFLVNIVPMISDHV